MTAAVFLHRNCSYEDQCNCSEKRFILYRTLQSEEDQKGKDDNVTYKEARVYLDEVSKYGSALGLDTVRELLHELGDPQKDLRFIHVAGTNGKGSVLAFISTILSEAGIRTGRYISPTVVSYLERIQIDGKWISEEEFAELVQEIQKAIVRMEAKGLSGPTVFEIETAIAFLYFRNMHCGIVVLETGLGGKEDATNIIEHTLVSVFTPISRDHMSFLGDTPEEIAEQKAGIIKPGCVVVSAPQEPGVRRVLERHAAEQGCEIRFVKTEEAIVTQEDYRGQTFSYGGMKDLNIRMAGAYQIINGVTAWEAVRAAGDAAGMQIREEAIRRGFENARWPGRFTCLRERPVFLVDGAHNADGALWLKKSVERYFPGRRLFFIMGVFRDKEYERIAQIMAPLAERIYTVSLPDETRTLSARELKKTAELYCKGTVLAMNDIDSAVEEAMRDAEEEDVILAFGSLSYLGRVMEIAATETER